MGNGYLELRLLGELQLYRDGREIALPPSKKTRALLAYLVATGTAHRREQLCDLLWDGPGDPRGELRWSLSKLRPLIDEGDAIRLKADRVRVAFEPCRVRIDLALVREQLRDIADASLESLRAAVGLFRGEFLDGLDLPACYRFHQWCLSEREALSSLRLAALAALVERLHECPEEALAHARSRVIADPLSEDAHAGVIRLLGRLGRKRDTLATYEHARKLLEKELGCPLSGALDRARLTLIRSRRSAPDASVDDAAKGAAGDRYAQPVVPFVGRLKERAAVDELVSASAGGRVGQLLLICGEPGIGKTRLLDHLSERMALIGGLVSHGRAFEAEAVYPYGAWIDVLRAIPADAIPADLQRNLALLRPDLGTAARESLDRARLFDAVVTLLRHLAGITPIAVVLDDLQWLDEASSSLLHYVIRSLDPPGSLLLAGAVRSGELQDNAGVASLVRAMERAGRLRKLELTGLSATETAELVQAVNPAADRVSVFDRSEGNPLFALETARSSGIPLLLPGGSLQAVIAEQLERLDESARQLLVWAAALGRSFSSVLLARLADFEIPVLLTSLEELERRGIIRAAGIERYDFVHDLIRQGVYQTLSQPRRRLVHGQIARHLAEVVTGDDSVAGDLVRHAELAGDHATAVRACILAGDRALRLFANAEARTVAQRGRTHLERSGDDPRQHEWLIGLLRIEVLSASGPGMRPLPRVVGELLRAIAAAEDAGLHAAAATGHYLLSVLYQESGDITQARQSTVRASEAGRWADRPIQARQLANTARCLIELETGIPQARALLREAETLLGPMAQEICELQWGLGLLYRWDGASTEARAPVERALALARQAGDRWREYKCLSLLALVELENGRYRQTRECCRELLKIAERLGEDEGPLAETLIALAELAEEFAFPSAPLDSALDRLCTVDDKSHLAYALNAAAAICLQHEQGGTAQAYAAHALETARAIERHNEIVIAEAMLARIDRPRDPRGSEAVLRRLRETVTDHDRFHARARNVVAAATAIEIRPGSRQTVSVACRKRSTSQ